MSVIASLALIVCPKLKAQQTETGLPAPVEVTVDASQIGAPISPYIYGQFIEHLGRCIYGGIWAEMLEDRKFYFPVPAPGEIWRLTQEQARVLAASPWKVIGPTGTVSMVEQDAFVGEHSPQIKAPGNGTAVGHLPGGARAAQRQGVYRLHYSGRRRQRGAGDGQPRLGSG